MITRSNKSTLVRDLEEKYRKSLHQIELLHRDEEARLLQLHALALQDDAAAITDELMQRDRRIEVLTQAGDKTLLGFEIQKEDCRNKANQLNKQALDLANLRAEVESLTTASKDSNKAIQEKLALSRELDRLRPEMEHLRSQVADYQSVVAQKHDLQRRLGLLEIEMENERRTFQQRHERGVDSLTNELRLKLEEAQKQAVIDRKERDGVRLEYERGLSEALCLSERLEKDILTLTSKLQNAQSDLTETQVELETCRAKLRDFELGFQDTENQKEAIPKFQSRRPTQLASKMKTQVPTQTPSKDESVVNAKRRRAAEQALVGGKSKFSITPFLNRTKSSLEDSVGCFLSMEVAEPGLKKQGSPSPVDVGNQVPRAILDARSSASGLPPTTASAQRPRGRPKANHLSVIPSSEKKKRLVSVTKHNKGQQPPALDRVLEESSQDQRTSNHATSAPQAFTWGEVAHGGPIVANGKRKRKLLSVNKGIFEDEEDETAQGTVKAPIGPPRKLKAPLKGRGCAFSSTSSFSPLKRDRRGVNASFLA